MKRLLAVLASPRTTWVLLSLAVGVGVWALYAKREQASQAVQQLNAGALALGLFAAIAVVLSSAMIWRTVLADLGTRLPLVTAAEIFLIGQVGKYLPGSVWPMVMQTQLGAKHGLVKRRVFAASITTMLISIGAAAVVVGLTLPSLPDLGGGSRWLGLLVIPVLVTLHPAVLTRVLDAGFRVLRRPPLQARTTLAGTAAAFGWALATWLFSAVLVLSLAHPLGLPLTYDSFALALGGYALAWLVGLLAVFLPAGVGARDGALVVILSTVLPTGSALVVSLLTRLTLTAVDLGAAGVAALAARRAGLIVDRDAGAQNAPEHSAPVEPITTGDEPE